MKTKATRTYFNLKPSLWFKIHKNTEWKKAPIKIKNQWC